MEVCSNTQKVAKAVRKMEQVYCHWMVFADIWIYLNLWVLPRIFSAWCDIPLIPFALHGHVQIASLCSGYLNPSSFAAKGRAHLHLPALIRPDTFLHVPWSENQWLMIRLMLHCCSEIVCRPLTDEKEPTRGGRRVQDKSRYNLRTEWWWYALAI